MTIPISSSANSHHSIPVHFTQPGFYSINTTPLMTSGSAILFPTIPSQRTIGTVGRLDGPDVKNGDGGCEGVTIGLDER